MARVSVITPVFNAECYIAEAIQSILDQSFADYEFIIINDASTDKSISVINSFHDPRIKIIDLQRNVGIASARNIGLEEATGDFVAFLDADDKSHPKRLEKQVVTMVKNDQQVICATWVQTFGRKVEYFQYKYDNDFLKVELLFDDPIPTSSVMLRNAVVEKHKLRFNPDFPPAEDYDLWERLSSYGTISTLPEVLTYYRIHDTQNSQTEKGKESAKKVVNIVHRRQIERLGVYPTEKELILHQRIATASYEQTMAFLTASIEWFEKLIATNQVEDIYNEKALRAYAKIKLFNIASELSDLGLSVFKQWHRFAPENIFSKPWATTKLFIKCLTGIKRR